jgi:hydrogenase maturation protein HypF
MILRGGSEHPGAAAIAAHRWRIGGRVQGVGFRPFIYRLAHRLGLTGWVRNDGGEVLIHSQGAAADLRVFGRALFLLAPPAAAPKMLESGMTPLEACETFRIDPSDRGKAGAAHIASDLSMCADCRREMLDPTARRHRYPFINCTQCGPRYTIIRASPYDRPNTTLAHFPLCADCAAEYADPLDRRFHAQPLACPVCGPRLRWHQGAADVDDNEAALAAAVAALREGLIIAVRGVGGYHLFCDAANETTVRRLRDRKGRPAKPLAMMAPWSGADGLDFARRLAVLSAADARALCAAERPIVIARRRDPATDAALAPAVARGIAPGLRDLALMLPYSPLHHLLLGDFGGALVATSGNLGGEPVLIEPQAAETRLQAIADGFLHHDRPIARPAEDPVLRINGGCMRPVRLGRGTAPVELELPRACDVPTLAVGAYLKTTVALAWGHRAVVSPHIGDLSTPRGREVFAEVAGDLQTLYGVPARRVVHDAHPDFPNSRWARDCGLPARAVWHHHAHAAAVAAEHPGTKPLLCFTWDGAGLGPDGTLWGGEALLGRPGAWRRVGSFRPFRLSGGDRAAREPWRSALGLCWQTGREWPPGDECGGVRLRQAFDADLNTHLTTAVGRLFDATAALLGICMRSSYEAEAPMLLESLCEHDAEPVRLPLERDREGVWRSDWAPLVPAMLDQSRAPCRRAEQMHASLAGALCDQALAIRQSAGVERIGLGGGVFQNRVLTGLVQKRLATAGFEVLLPQRLPVNDAAISYGQLIEAGALGHHD